MIKITKLGTLDLDIVESNPIIFKNKLFLMEYIRYPGPGGKSPAHGYYANTLGKPYCRFRDMSSGQQFSPPFGESWCFGCAFADHDHIAVTVTERWGGNAHYLIESDDMIHWSEPRKIFASGRHRCYNSSMCKAGNKYVNALELAKLELSASGDLQCEMHFAESTDLINWKIIENGTFNKGAPMLRFYDNWYFYFYLDGNYRDGFTNRIARSRDLITWEICPEPVLKFDDEDKKIHPLSNFNAAQLETIAYAKNINVSDMDMCDCNGKLIISYSWGDQRGHEFLALAQADCSEREFCLSCF